MTLRLFVTLSLLVGFLTYGTATPATAQDRTVSDQVVAVVGSDIILKSEVDQMVASMQQQQQQSPDTVTPELWEQGLHELINQRVMAEIAERDTNIVIPDEQIDAQLQRQIQQMAQQAGGEQELEEMYGQSIAELQENFRDEFRAQMLADEVRRQRMERVRITPTEVEEWFNQIPEAELPILPESVRMSHIVRYPEPTDAAKEEAEEIITTIRDSITTGGADFEDMASQFSEDPGSARNGGRISGVTIDNFVPEFAAVAARLPEGEISEPFYNPTHTGYHIVRVNERRGNTVDLNHILIQVDRRSADESEAIEYLEAVRDSIVNMGQPFGRMASRHSQETRSADMAGRVIDPQSGTRDLVLEQLGSAWRETINSIEEGEISEPRPVRLLDGERAFHIVKLHRRTPEHRISLDMDYERIREFALQEKQARVMEEWIEDQRESVFVEIKIDDPSDVMALN